MVSYEFISKNEVLQAIVDGYRVIYLGFVSNNKDVVLANLNTRTVNNIKTIIEDSDECDIFVRAKMEEDIDNEE